MPSAGSYNSEEDKAAPALFLPPIASTLPDCKRIVLWRLLAVARLPVFVQFPVPGLYISQVAV